MEGREGWLLRHGESDYLLQGHFFCRFVHANRIVAAGIPARAAVVKTVWCIIRRADGAGIPAMVAEEKESKTASSLKAFIER